jgi:hypothetical protein
MDHGASRTSPIGHCQRIVHTLIETLPQLSVRDCSGSSTLPRQTSHSLDRVWPARLMAASPAQGPDNGLSPGSRGTPASPVGGVPLTKPVMVFSPVSGNWAHRAERRSRPVPADEVRRELRIGAVPARELVRTIRAEPARRTDVTTL